jgi:hypothetical protein
MARVQQPFLSRLLSVALAVRSGRLGPPKHLWADNLTRLQCSLDFCGPPLCSLLFHRLFDAPLCPVGSLPSTGCAGAYPDGTCTREKFASFRTHRELIIRKPLTHVNLIFVTGSRIVGAWPSENFHRMSWIFL